jgi:hypothetical protein
MQYSTINRCSLWRPLALLFALALCSCQHGLPTTRNGLTLWTSLGHVLVVADGKIGWTVLEFDGYGEPSKAITTVGPPSPCGLTEPTGLSYDSTGFVISCSDGSHYLFSWNNAVPEKIEPCENPKLCDETGARRQYSVTEGRYAWINRGREVRPGALIFDYHSFYGSFRCKVSSRYDLAYGPNSFAVLNGKDWTEIRISLIVEAGGESGVVLLHGMSGDSELGYAIAGFGSSEPRVKIKCEKIEMASSRSSEEIPPERNF